MISENPKNINNIKYWFDSSDVSTLSLTGIGSVTASVLSITDKINGVVMLSDGTSSPIFYYNNINNNDSIYFGFTSSNPLINRLSSSSCTFSSIGSIYSVTKSDIISGNPSGSYAITISPSNRVDNTYGDYQVQYLGTNSSIFSTDSGLTASIGLFNGLNNSLKVDVYSIRYNTSTLTKFCTIAPSDVKNGYTNATYSITSLSNRLTIGNYYTQSSSNFGFVGYFCELLFFDRYLSDTEDNQISQYLIKKWIG
jgi:hypothetical protein